MYAVDERDEVISLSDLPPSDPGATRPFIMQDEGATVVAYYLPEGDVDLTDEAAWAADPDFGKETVALVRFVGVSATYFGRPND